MVILVILALSFTPALSWITLPDGSFSRCLHVFTSMWIGIFGNLMIFIVIAWVAIFILKKFKIDFKIKFIGILALAFGIGLSIMGFINAANPVVKELNIKMSNLPENWKGKKIVQLSDVHFGSINNIKFLEKIVKKVNDLQPDLIVYTGDLFDREDGVGPDFVDTMNKMKPKDGSYFAFGNHDVYFGMDNVKKIMAESGIKILSDEMVNINGLQLIGLDGWEFTGRTDIKDVLEKIAFDKNKPSVLLYHVPANVAEIKAGGINLWLAGHTHRGQLWPINWLITWVYKGYGHGLFQDNNFFLYVSAGTGSWGPSMRTSGPPEIVVINLE